MLLLFFALGQALSISVFISERFLKQRRNYMFSFIFACLACAALPFGTILGVFTIIVLSRPTVKETYGRVSGGSGTLAALEPCSHEKRDAATG